MVDPALKQDINVAVCGHADHGKSTLIGKTAVEIGLVSRRKLEQLERESPSGDHSFVFARLVFRQKDASHEDAEAARGITVLPAFVRMDFPAHRVTLIDTPGQETYTNNRFAGLFSADCAVLVVDVAEGVMAVTEQVIRALKGYEIPIVAVAMTKMDRIEYDQRRFEDAVDLVRLALATYGVSDAVPFIPTSAYSNKRALTEPGEGLTRFGDKLAWYRGPSFHGLMGSLSLGEIREGPLRIVIHSADIYANVPGVGTAFTGLVESGRLRREQMLHFEPASAEHGEPVTAEVRSVELTKGHLGTPGIPLAEAHPRQLVGVALARTSEKGLRALFKGRGTIAGPLDEPPRVARRFVAEITVFDRSVPIRPGHQLIMHAHVDKVAVNVRSVQPVGVRNSVDDEDAAAPGEEAAAGAARAPAADAEHDAVEVKEGDTLLRPGQWARVELEAIRPVAIEEARRLPALSKLVLRVTNEPIGLGKCVEILE